MKISIFSLISRKQYMESSEDFFFFVVNISKVCDSQSVCAHTAPVKVNFFCVVNPE